MGPSFFHVPCFMFRVFRVSCFMFPVSCSPAFYAFNGRIGRYVFSTLAFNSFSQTDRPGAKPQGKRQTGRRTGQEPLSCCED